MPTHTLSNHDSFPYDDIPPGDDGVTFAFFNALSGDRGMWLQSVGDKLQAAGHGLLAWNFRGQPETSFTITQTDAETIVSDSLSLIGELQPKRLVYVGLSIGGLYAIRAHLKGGAGAAVGLVLINTLRKSGPRLDWVNHAVVRMAETGGLAMMRDFYAPLLMNQAWQAENRDAFFSTDYEPLPDGDGTLMLLKSGISADWDIPYEKISIPTLS
ncbi:MAG: alpha/beta hydrolase, partial [Pseudomonadota bacterium]